LKRKQQAMSRKIEAAKRRFEAAKAADDGLAQRSCFCSETGG